MVKAWFVFRNPHCPILRTTLHRLQFRIMSGSVGIRLQSVLSGYPAGRKFSCPVHLYSKVNTEAKRCFATHDEDIDYFKDAEKSYIFNRMRIYSTVQLCSITSLWHSGQHLCRAIGRLQVRISLGFWLFSKRRSL